MQRKGTTLRPGWWADMACTVFGTLCYLAIVVFIVVEAATSPKPVGAAGVAIIAMLAGLSPMVLLGAAAYVDSLLMERRRWLRREDRR